MLYGVDTVKICHINMQSDSSLHCIIALIDVAIRFAKGNSKLCNCEPGPELVSAH